MKYLFSLCCCLLAAGLPQPLLAQNEIPALTPADYALRKEMTGVMYRHRSLDSFLIQMEAAYGAADNQTSREKILEFWANHLVATFGAYDRSIRFVDSLLTHAELSDNSRQSLEVRQFSSYSDQRIADKLDPYTQTFLDRLNTNTLRLNDTIDYFILAVVFSEMQEFAAAQRVLTDVAYHGRNSPITLWRTYLTMAYFYVQVNDYDNALRMVERYLPLTDTSKMSLAVCSSGFAQAAFVYARNKQYAKAYHWAERSVAGMVPGQLFERQGSLATMCQAAMALDDLDAAASCQPILASIPDTTLPQSLSEMLHAVAYEYAAYAGRPLAELRNRHAAWTDVRAQREELRDYLELPYLTASLRLAMRRRDDAAFPALLDSLNARHEAQLESKATRINNELVEQHRTRIRQDSIANLTVRSELAEVRAGSRQRQLWLTLALLAAVATGLGFTYRNSRRRKELNDDLARKNARISLLNADINHRTSGYLSNIVRLLEEQRYKLEDAGADPHVLDELGRQTLVYTKLQHLLTTSADRTVVNLRAYLTALTDLLLASFRGSDRPLHLTLTVDDIDVDPRLAAPLALTLNELMTNTAKYARRRNGLAAARFTATRAADDTLLFDYADDGPAAAADQRADFSSHTGLGLIAGLTDQMEGRREATDGYGWRVRVDL